jgi:alanine dehydrogenase
VPNITSLVGRTATHALSYATVPYLLALANLGLERALATYSELGRGVNVREGQLVHPGLTAATRPEAER